MSEEEKLALPIKRGNVVIGYDLIIPEPELLDLIRPNGRPNWTRLPSIKEALLAFQEHRRSVVVQVNGLTLSGDIITPTGHWRCRTVAEALVRGQIPWEATIITSGCKFQGELPDGSKFEGRRSEGEVFREDILKCLVDFGEPRTESDICVEDQAQNTFDNARRCAEIVTKLVHTGEIARPYLLIIATTDWHFDRQELTNAIVPEASEFKLWMEAFPGLQIRALRAPYPPWTSNDDQTRWLARVHVATHFFAPLQANLSAIRDERLVNRENRQELRGESVAVFGAALSEFKILLESPPLKGSKIRFVTQTMEAVFHEWPGLVGLHSELKNKITDNHSYLVEPFNSPADKVIWTSYSDRLRQHTRAIRYISDPDRR